MKGTNIDGDVAIGRNLALGGNVVAQGMAHIKSGLRVDGWLDAENIKAANKGLFQNESELKKEYPKPLAGWFAVVIDDIDKGTGFIYTTVDGTWKKTQEQAMLYEFIMDSANVFATKNEFEQEKKRVQEIDDELLSRIQGTSEDSDAVKDPFKLLSKTNGVQYTDINELINILNGMHANEAESARTIRGIYRAMINEDVVTIIINPLDVLNDVWIQAVIGNFKITDGVLSIGYNDFGIFYRKYENNNWGVWKLSNEDVLKEWIANVDTNVINASTELLKRIQGTSDNSSAWSDAFKKIKDFNTLQSLDTYLQGWHGETVDSTKDFIGNFRTNVAGAPIEIFSTVVGYGDKSINGDTSVWVQEIKGAIDIDKGAVNHLGTTDKGFIDTKFISKDEREWYSRTYKQGLRFVSRTNNSGIHTLRRIYDGTLGGWGEWIDIDNPYITSPLYGKSILILGGSFAHNMKAYNSGKTDEEGNLVIDGNKNSGFGFDIEGRKYSLQNYIAKQLGLKRFDNFAVSGNGACISNSEFSCNIYQQLVDALECAAKHEYKYDAIIFQGGINDYQAESPSPLGSLTDLAGDNTFYASYKKIINLARTNEQSKDAKLFMTTPFKAFHKMECWKSTEQIVNAAGHRYYDYLQAIRDIAQYASIPLLDIWSIQQVDSNNYGRYYRNQAGDDTHPNGQGYLQVAPAFIEFLAWGKGGVNVDIESYIKPIDDKITAEIQRAKDAEQANRQLIADLVGESPETLDTIHEISSWILNDETGAAAMAKKINENKNAIEEGAQRAEEIAGNLEALALDVEELQGGIPNIKNQAARLDGNAFSATANEVKLTTTGVNISKQWTVSLPTATPEKAGVMSAADKKKLDINTNIALLDVTRIFPTGGTNGTEIYADLKAALNVVPSSSVYKKNIKFLTFRTSDTTRELWQFDGVGNDTAIAFDDKTKWHKVDPDMFWDLEFSTTASDFSVNQNTTRAKVPYHSRKKGMIIRYTDTKGEEYVEIYNGLSGDVSGAKYYSNFIRLVSYQTVFCFKKHEGVEGNDCLCIKEVFIDKYTEGASYRFLEGTISSSYPTGYFRLRETLNGVNTDTYVKPTLNENGISEITTNTFHAYIVFDWNKFDTTLGFVERDILFTDSAKSSAFSPMIYAAISVANLDAELRPLAQTGAGLSSKLYAEQELIYENLSEQAGNKDYQYTNIGLIHRAEERQTFNRIALNFRAPSASYANTGSIVVKTVSSTPAVGKINNAVLIKQIDGVNNMDFPSSGLYTIDLDYNITLETGECLIVYYTNYVKIRTWEPIDTDSVDRPGWYFQGEYKTSKGSSAMTLSIKKGDLAFIEDRVKKIEEILGIEGDVEEGTITEPLVAMIDDLYVPVGVKQKFYYNEFIYGDESTVNNTLNWRIQTKINSSSVGMKCVADEEGFTIYSHTAGDYILTITIYDSMKNQKWQGNVNLHIFQPQSVSGKNILMLGASWIDINSGHKGYTPYINDALQEIGINLNFIGTRDAGTSGLKHEGIGGYGYQTFVTAPSVVRFKFYFDAEPSISKDDTYSNNGSTYQLFEKGSGYITMSRISGSTEPSGNTLTKTSGTGDATITFNSWTLGGSNPLWNTTTNKLDFTHYRRDLCGLSSPIDFCVTQLGVNDSLGALKTTKTDWQPYLDAATTLFDEILRDSPNCKIVVGLGAMGAPGTTGWSGLFGLSSGDKRTFQMNSYYLRIYLNETIKSRDDYKQNVFIGQSVLGINRWHGYLHYDAREIYCKINADASVINQLKSYNFQDSQPFAYLKDSEGKIIIGATNIVRYDRRGYIVLRKWSGNWDSFDYEFVKKDVELPTSGKIELHNKSISGMPTELNFTECNQEDNNSAEHVFTNATHPADLGYRQMAYCAAWQVAFLLK